MQRRDFLGTTCLAGAAALGAMAPAAHAGDAPKKQYLELRLYRLGAGAMRERFEKFLAEAAIPAWNRAGVKPVGVFGAADGKTADLYVLLPHESAEAFATSAQRVWDDAEYRKAGGPMLDAGKDDPLYQRIESSLMLAFDGIPKVETPTKKDSRLFQLRIYESPSDAKAKKKVEMFNTGGELTVFRAVGMGPVFFGETLVGTKVPNLTYMLGFDDEVAQKAGWDKFGAHPDWIKMRDDPQYKDTVSNITNLVLRPAACSQI